MQRLLPDSLAFAAVELAPYFEQSFGNATRIDYGTGHEMTFCAFLYCLVATGKLRKPPKPPFGTNAMSLPNEKHTDCCTGALEEKDSQALVTKVFAAYLELMRKVQTTYW